MLAESSCTDDEVLRVQFYLSVYRTNRLRRRAPQLCGADGIWSKAQFYGCGTWDVEGLAEAHDELDELEEDEEEECLLSRSGMSEYYGSEGFDHPRLDVYSYGGGFFGDDGPGAC